jgi:hypothetical protein
MSKKTNNQTGEKNMQQYYWILLIPALAFFAYAMRMGWRKNGGVKDQSRTEATVNDGVMWRAFVRNTDFDRQKAIAKELTDESRKFGGVQRVAKAEGV